MKTILSFIFYTACALIAVWLIRPTLFWIIGLEFSDPEFLFSYRWVWIYILPIAVCLTIVNKMLGKEPQNSWSTAVISRLGIGVLAYISVWISIFTGMCGWREVELYYLQNHQNGKVVLMEYSCGAYDSDIHPKRETRRILPYCKYFQWNHACDSTKLDMTIWKSVK